jgi:NADH-quinone oxidoreductase subunit M
MTNMPLFPMHYWLPDAHTEASTQGSMLLSGILTKFGGFGMIILFTIIPLSSSHSLYIAALATLSAIYGALIMIRQTDLKRVIAYSTIVEMGVIMVAISAGNALGTSGAIYGMLSHGLIVAFMFLAVGFIKHTFKERNITRLRGILSNAKTTAYMFMLGALAMVGLPLTSGFVAEVLIFLGAAQAFGLYGLLPLIPIIIMGAFMYGIVSKIILSSNEPSERFDYVSADQKIGYYIIAASIVAVGILPFFILNLLKL